MNLSEYLEDTGKTKAKIAQEAGLSYGVIMKVFRGCNITFFSAMAICEASRWRINPIELLQEIRLYGSPRSSRQQCKK